MSDYTVSKDASSRDERESVTQGRPIDFTPFHEVNSPPLLHLIYLLQSF